MVIALEGLNPILQALLATLFTWGVTALGAAAVFVTRQVNKRLLQGMLGFAAGVMIAASFWSLLAPAIEMTEAMRRCRLAAGRGRVPRWRRLPVRRRPPPAAPAPRAFHRGGGRDQDLLAAQRPAGPGDHAAQHPGGPGRRRGLRRGGGRAAVGDPGRRRRPGHRHRPAELPGGHGRLHAAPRRGADAAARRFFWASSPASSSRSPASWARPPSCSCGRSCPTPWPSPPGR